MFWMNGHVPLKEINQCDPNFLLNGRTQQKTK